MHLHGSMVIKTRSAGPSMARTALLCYFATLGSWETTATFSDIVVNSRIQDLDCFMDKPFSKILKPWQSAIELGLFPASRDGLDSAVYKQVRHIPAHCRGCA
jgi:hypothetical protein